jgi:hypothetical protein
MSDKQNTPGGRVIHELPDFARSLSGHIVVVEANDEVQLCLVFKSLWQADWGQRQEPQPVPPPVILANAPRAKFSSDLQLVNWARRVYGTFTREMSRSLVLDLAFHAADAARLFLFLDGITTDDRDRICDDHVAMVRARVRTLLALRGPRGALPLNHFSLSALLVEAFKQMDRAELAGLSKTKALNEVHERMMQHYPDAAHNSTKALIRDCQRKKVDVPALIRTVLEGREMEALARLADNRHATTEHRRSRTTKHRK